MSSSDFGIALILLVLTSMSCMLACVAMIYWLRGDLADINIRLSRLESQFHKATNRRGMHES